MSGRLFNFLAAQPWACTEAYLDRMVEVYFTALDRKGEGLPLDRHAVEKELGRPLDNTRTVTTRNGVATIPIEGAIFRRADMFTEISGATTIDSLAKDFNAALNDNSVRAIVFEIDSPGGEVAGTNEFADQVLAARGRKPTVAYVSHQAASGAYWIASACDEIVCDATASLGSVGVVIGVPDPTKQNKRHIEFVSSQSKNKRADPTTERGKELWQSHADALAEVFVNAVARNRQMTPEKVMSDFGNGFMLVGKDAVKAGLADRTGSYESVLKELQSGYTPKAKDSTSAGARANTTNNGEKVMGESKGWFARMWASLTDDERKEASAEIGIKAEAKTEPRADAETLRKAAAYDALLAERSTERAGQREADATANANEIIKANKALPAAFESLKCQFLAAAEDDEARPLPTGSRVANLKATFEHVKAHALTDEKAAGAKVLTDAESAEQKTINDARAGAAEWMKAQQPTRLQEVK